MANLRYYGFMVDSTIDKAKQLCKSMLYNNNFSPRGGLSTAKKLPLEGWCLISEMIYIHDRKVLKFWTEYKLQYLPKLLHNDIMDVFIAFNSIELPPHVLLWIIDWLPDMDFVTEYQKMQWIWKLMESRNKQIQSKSLKHFDKTPRYNRIFDYIYKINKLHNGLKTCSVQKK